LRDYHGRKLVGHTGGVAGFVSRVMLVPEENLGVVILTNAEEGGAFDSVLFRLLDSYLVFRPRIGLRLSKLPRMSKRRRLPRS